ncbi:pumilio homolog 23-like [Phragmites australis]|uniref:pumilio homolog 23-like n=1 Tax=Phragmites australis TaxID=29695 RepID=UPI002D79373A|nr:pumilio homolog 23-like [Phragmites australis]
MVCFGSKAIRPKGSRQNGVIDGGLDDGSLKRGRKDKSQKPRKGGHGSGEKTSVDKSKHGLKKQKQKKGEDGKKGKGQGKMNPGPTKNQDALPFSNASKPAQNVLRKRVDPETAKYYMEISNLFDNKEIDLEERSAICANALEETKGKELELATDAVISHTLQVLVEGCELEQLCTFLRNCVGSFPVIAMNKFGSHVAEAALKSLATHLEDETSRAMVEEILNKMCKVIVADAANVMSSCYGSHVLRTLLCLCKGVPVESLQDFHTTKRSAVLAERLSCGRNQSGGHGPKTFENGFSDIFKYFVREMLHSAKADIATLRVDKNSSLVLQTALKLSSGDDNELHHIISILLGYDEDDSIQRRDYNAKENEIVTLLEETAYSHLLEVIVEVAPEELRNGMLVGTLRGALFAISSHHCGNYVVQALISSAKTSDQMKQIWEELGPKIKELLELGKTGVVASILAACQRLEIYRLESSQALAAALSSDSDSPDSIVAHILFLENFLRERSYWTWPLGAKMSVLGCLMLQSIFQYPHQYIRPYVASLLAMEDDQILQISKDSGGSRVLEAFLCSSATAKRKFKVFGKLQGHYGEIAMSPSGSFLVEKCFTASNFSHKEAIVVELLVVQYELSKTRHGFHLLKKLDVDRYARRPEQWRASQTSKETTQRQFEVEFGSNSKPVRHNIEEQFSPQSPTKKRKQKEKTDNVTEDASSNKPDFSQKGNSKRLKSAKAIYETESSSKKLTEGTSTSASTAFLKDSGKRKSLGFLSDIPSLKKQNFHRPTSGKSDGKKFVQDTGKQKQSIAELADLAGKEKLTAAEVRKLLKPEMPGKT